jgi:hypothetical protein
VPLLGNTFDGTLGYPGEGPTKPIQFLKIGTANITSHGSVSKLQLDTASVWLIQEHRLKDSEEIHVFRNKLLKKGWKSSIQPANATSKGSTSGGVGIIWQMHLDVCKKPEVIQPGRCTAMGIRIAGIGEVNLLSIYGWTGEGPSDRNIDLVRKALAAGAGSEGKSNFVLGGTST